MDILSLYYFSEVTKDLHITRTANRLFISQQTLSNHIMRLEEYYNVPLLNRKPSLSLTYAGEHVLKFANMILRENGNLKDIISDISHEERGVILFGSSRFRMNFCLPNILPDFSIKYPNVEIRMTDSNSSQLENSILNGEIDLAIVIGVKENPSIHKIHLMYDNIYLCVTDELLRKYYPDEVDLIKEKSRSEANIRDFAKLPFCILNNRMGQKIQKCFDEAKIIPNIYTTSSYIQIATSIGLCGLAACFATQTSLLNQKDVIPDDINFFPLYQDDSPLKQELFIIHHKDRYITEYNQYFLELTLNYFRKIENLSLKSSE